MTEAAATCPVDFTPADPDPCPHCTCDRDPGHTGHHHCPDCDVWYTLASDVTRAPRAGNQEESGELLDRLGNAIGGTRAT